MSESKSPPVEAGTSAPEDTRFHMGASPHVHAPQTVRTIMWWVVIALLPAAAASIWWFGLEALRVLVLSTAFCAGIEYLCLRFMGTEGEVSDGSAVVTGLLLGMNLPPQSPWWLIAVGSVVAIVVAKHLFGGLGSNIFNPALTARVFLLVSWPTLMTTWMKPGIRGLLPSGLEGEALKAVTEATPLGLLKEGGIDKIASNLMDLGVGNVGGSVGEVSAAALLLGGLILLAKRIITWEIPVTFIGTVYVFTWIAQMMGSPGQFASPEFHVLAGGLFLGAFFMATDMVTSPISFRGRVVFGIGCGLLTAIIRLWGGYPEGVSFAILLMNAFTPMIDSYMRPKTFGSRTIVKKVAP